MFLFFYFFILVQFFRQMLLPLKENIRQEVLSVKLLVFHYMSKITNTKKKISVLSLFALFYLYFCLSICYNVSNILFLNFLLFSLVHVNKFMLILFKKNFFFIFVIIILNIYNQRIFLYSSNIRFVIFFFQANSDASVGKYAGGVSGAAGDAGLFVANHAY